MQAQLTYCPRCGAPNGHQHGFCGRCGEALATRVVAQQPVRQAPAPPPQQQQYAPPPPQQPRYVPPPQQQYYAPPPQQHYAPSPQQQYAPPAPRQPQYTPPPQTHYAPPPPQQQYYAPQQQQYAPPAPPQYQQSYAPPQPRYPAQFGAGYAAAAVAPVAPAVATWGPPGQPAYHPGAFGYGVAASPRAVTGARRHHWGLWAIASSLVAVILVGLVVVGLVAIRPQPTACTGPQCSVPPPRGEALKAPHTYTSSTYHYTVRYYNAPGGYSPALASRVSVTTHNATSIDWKVDLSGVDPAGGTWPYGFKGMSANGKSARQVVMSVIDQNAQGGQPVYAIPNAMVGFVHGYGEVYDVQAQSSEGSVVPARYIVMAAVHNGVAVVFTALGPYNAKQQDHPDPADTIVSVVASPLVNDVTFQGMPVR